MIMTEQGVVDAVKAWLEGNGFIDVDAIRVGSKGYDIQGVQSSTGEHWLIEAKGGSHSGEDSSSRAWVGVGAAFLMTAGWRYQPDLAGKRFAFAVPDARWFNIHVARIEEALRVLGISVFRVSETGMVTFVENHPPPRRVETPQPARSRTPGGLSRFGLSAGNSPSSRRG